MRLHRSFYAVTCCSYLRCPETIPCAKTPACSASSGRSGPSRRSIVAADIETTNAAVASGMISSSKRRSRATNSAMTGARCLPVGAPSTAQQNASATTTSGPYRGGRGARGRTSFGVNAAFSALRAWLRCHPVVAVPPRGCGATPWWRTTHRGFCPSPPCSRARTASRSSWSPHVAGPHPCRRAPTRALQRESTTTLTRAYLMSQRGGLRVSGGRDKAGRHDRSDSSSCSW
jgi:hypothetical protein